MEIGRRSESLEISMPMPTDDEHSKKNKSPSSHGHPNKPRLATTKISKTDAKNREIQVYKNLITLLWQNEQRVEYNVIIEISIFLCFVGIIIASFIAQELKQQLLLGLQPWKWILLFGSVFCGLSLVRLGTFIILQYLIVPIFKLHKSVVFFARGLKTSMDVLLWLGLLLAFWLTWFRKGIAEYTEILHYVTRTLIALVLGAFFWILKSTLLLKLESDLHLNRFFYRIRYAVLHLHGVQMIDKRGNWSFGGIKDREKFLDSVDSMKEGVPTWVLKSLANLFEKSLKELSFPHEYWEFCDDNELNEKAGLTLLHKVVYDPPDDDSQTKSNDRKSLREVLSNLDKDCRCISQDDLQNRGGLTKNEAKVLIRLIQVFEMKKDTYHPYSSEEEEEEAKPKTFITWVSNAYRTCWSLPRWLNNSREARNQLNKILTSFLVMVVIVMWLLLTEIATQSTIALALSPFLAASFIFGDSCRTMFQGIIFAFVMHPFEVGDRCVIDGQQMKVDRINILTTELQKYDNGEPTVYPNSVLASKDIGNFRGVPNRNGILQFNIDPATPWEAIEGLKAKIEQYLHEDPHLGSDVEVVMEDFGKMVVHFMYLVSYPDSKEKARWKSELLSTIRKILQGLDIKPTSYYNDIKL